MLSTGLQSHRQITPLAPLAGSSAPKAADPRNHSIDAFRVIANWVIICVHTGPFLAASFSPQVRLGGELLNQFVRVATPFFFLASGYFFASSLSRGAHPISLAIKQIRRLILFFAFWSLVYILVPVQLLLHRPDMGYWSAVRGMIWRALSPSYFPNGPEVHLWFLPALACALALLAAACQLRRVRSLMFLAAALFVFGLIAGAYKVTSIGVDLGINTRNGPFFSTIFVVSGFMFHRLDIEPGLRRALGLITLGIALRILELLWITGTYGASPSDIDYLLGTYPFGIGIFMLLLATKRLGEIKWMVWLARYSAGVYCAHMLVVHLLDVSPAATTAPFWEVIRPFAALALTYLLVVSLAKVPGLRPVLT